MADDEPRAGELVTANYGWTKPTVGASDDQWGGYLNADLDGIDSIVHGIDTRPPYALPIASTTVLGGVKVDGTTIHAAGDGTLTGTPSSGPPVTISDTAPASPQAGALWYDSVGGQLYTFYNDGNSSQWVIAVNSGALLAPASTTVLGGVKVDGTTIKAAADGTISTVVVPMGDNRIINGDMRIDQRNAGASGTANGYTIDRWAYGASIVGKGTWSRYAHGPGAIATTGCGYNLGFTSASAYAPLTADAFYFHQPVEADMAGDFAWGGAGAQPVTLSFWVISSLTGTFSGAIRNYPLPSTRSYPFSFNIPVANTYTKIAITIPGDTAGTWVPQGNAAALAVIFDLGSGATWRGPANAWAAGNFVGANGAQSVVATNGATYNITGVKLEIGGVATPFNRQSPAKSLADCQRYYAVLGPTISGSNASGAGWQNWMHHTLPTTMRAAPTVAFAGTTYNNANNLTASQLSASSASTILSAAAAGGYWANYQILATAEL